MPRSRSRRATDYPPLSHIVTAGNLDDRLETVATRQNGHEALDVERWDGHKNQHIDLAGSLKEYKSEANEWRQTLADLRVTFIPKAEFQSEHRALDAKLGGQINGLTAKYEALDAKVDILVTDLKTIATDREARRSVFSDSRSVILLIIAVTGIALAVIDRLPHN